jgi:hypothetical protein
MRAQGHHRRITVLAAKIADAAGIRDFEATRVDDKNAVIGMRIETLLRGLRGNSRLSACSIGVAKTNLLRHQVERIS